MARPCRNKRISATELQVTLDDNLLKRAGRFDIVVKNPEPLVETSNGGMGSPTRRIFL